MLEKETEVKFSLHCPLKYLKSVKGGGISCEIFRCLHIFVIRTLSYNKAYLSLAKPKKQNNSEIPYRIRARALFKGILVTSP